MNAHPEAVDELTARIEALEKRVTNLEDHQPEAAGLKSSPAAAKPIADPVESGVMSGTGIIPVLGSSLLGIAGAYLLRALSGTTLFQRRIVATVAAAYAVAWLVAALRSVKHRQAAGVFFAATSLLIVSPMMWEMCLRFQAMSPAVAAALLAAYAATATVLARQSGRRVVLSVACIGVAASALALLVATHDMAPFALVLLAMVAVSEYAHLLGIRMAARPVIALICDVAVWSILFVYRLPATDRPEYPPLGWHVAPLIGCALFFLWTCGLAIRVLRQRQIISVFDGIQAVISFLLAAVTWLWFVPGAGPVALGACCLILSGACYASAFGPFRNAPSRRNFHVFAVWAASLLVTGAFLCAPQAVAAGLLAVSALCAILAARRIGTGSITLALHGLVFLTVAVVAARVHFFVFGALIGQVPSHPGWNPLLVIGCAVLAFSFSGERPGEDWHKQAIHLSISAVAACTAIALVASGIVGLASLIFSPSVFHVALIRTVTICAAALGLALGGSRGSRPAMTRIAYGALALAAAKLLFEDLRHGHMEYIAASICLVALTLIAVPKIAHRQPRP
ncbi:MAG TPA: hypothetical protein VKB38_19500 [Terracidiphilus sp.]|nr:hypothetical protein [Terracidiphilus sp.]